MYVVSKDGRKFRINEEDVDESVDWHWPFKDGLVAVCDDDEYMKNIWIITIKKCKRHPLQGNEREFEIITELEYDHEPSQEELLYLHRAYGEGKFYTYVFVNEAYISGYKKDEK